MASFIWTGKTDVLVGDRKKKTHLSLAEIMTGK